MLKQTLDTRIEAEFGLTLQKVESRHVIGSKGVRYFALLNPKPLGASEKKPEGVLHSPNYRDIEVEISEGLYHKLVKARGEGSAYGKVTLELYTRSLRD